MTKSTYLKRSVVASSLVFQGAIIGGMAGGVAGDAVSVVMKDMDIVLPAGSHLMLTVREPLTVSVSTN
jgi:hypothetical protein